MTRRNLIKSLIEEQLAAANSAPAAAAPVEQAPPAQQPQRTLAGPVRTMGLTLDKIEDEARALKELWLRGRMLLRSIPRGSSRLSSWTVLTMEMTKRLNNSRHLCVSTDRKFRSWSARILSATVIFSLPMGIAAGALRRNWGCRSRLLFAHLMMKRLSSPKAGELISKRSVLHREGNVCQISRGSRNRSPADHGSAVDRQDRALEAYLSCPNGARADCTEPLAQRRSRPTPLDGSLRSTSNRHALAVVQRFYCRP